MQIQTGPSVRTSFFLLTFFHVFAQERSQLNFATSLSTAHLSVYKHFIFKQPIVSEERKTVDYIPFFCRVRFEGLKYIWYSLHGDIWALYGHFYFEIVGRRCNLGFYFLSSKLSIIISRPIWRKNKTKQNFSKCWTKIMSYPSLYTKKVSFLSEDHQTLFLSLFCPKTNHRKIFNFCPKLCAKTSKKIPAM